MRMRDLSRDSGVPVPTIKFYQRAGLVPPGTRTGRNQAEYDEAHLRRLHLVRILVEVGGLSLDSVRGVLEALSREGAPLHDALSAAHTALGGYPTTRGDEIAETRAETDAWLRELGWDLAGANPAHDDLAAALLALRRLGWSIGPEAFARYAEHADLLAEAELAYVAEQDEPMAAVEATVIGTVIFERVLAALRRLAQEHHSRRRFGAA